MRGKRVLSFIMALVMALSLCGNVWAENESDGGASAVDGWIEEYINYSTGDDGKKVCTSVKGVSVNSIGYLADAASHVAALNAYNAYKALSDADKDTIEDEVIVLLPSGENYGMRSLMDECRCLTTLPYYGMMDGVTDTDVTGYINKYVGWQGWENEYNTFFIGMWKNGVYQSTVVKAALDAYDALTADVKGKLNALPVWDGDPRDGDGYKKSFGTWIELKRQEYNDNAGVYTKWPLLDPAKMTDDDAKAFIDEYFRINGTYFDNGIECLNIWPDEIDLAPDGGHMTQASYDQAVALLAAYNSLPDAAKTELDKLRVSIYDPFSKCFFDRFGNPRMTDPNKGADTSALSPAAQQFLTDAGLSIVDGALTINNANMVKKGDKWYFKIDYAPSGVISGTGAELASMNAAAQALRAYYGREFDKSLKEGNPFFEPLRDRNNDACNELDELCPTVNGIAMWFNQAMGFFWNAYDNTKYGGDYEEYFFRAAGYVAPQEGTDRNTDPKDFVVRVPDGLVEGVDYNYTYTADSGDPAVDGVLTIHVMPGVKEHWLKAVQNTNKVSLNSGVLFSLDFKRPDTADRYVSICGQGIDGVFADYLDLSNEAKQRLYNTGYDMSQNEKWVGNGRMMASINQVGDTLTVTSSDAYGVDHMLMVWYENAKNSNGGTDDLTEVGNRFMIGIRVVVDEPFSYEFDVSTRTATVASVDLDAGWERIDPEGKDLIVRPVSGKTIADLAPQNKQGDWSLGTFTLTPPDTGYTLDVQESNKLTQEGQLWEDNDPNTDNTLNLYTHDDRTNTVFYTFVWKKADAPEIREELTVRVTEAQSVFAGIGKGEGDSKITAQPVTNENYTSETNEKPIGNMSTKYDATLGFMETTFNGLPPIEGVRKLRDGEGVTMQPPEGATHFRVQDGDGNRDWAYINESFAGQLTDGLAHADSETYALNELTRDAKKRLTLAYAAVDVLEVEGLSIYFATTQNYRYKVVEWLQKGEDDSYTTVGYTYIYGKNGPMVKTETTKSVTNISEVPKDESDKAYFVCDADVNFTCNQYVQEGAANCWYFRLSVDNEGAVKTSGGYVYLPYSFFGGLTYEEARQRADKPVILHYAKGDGTEPTRIEGEYTEYGVCFKTNSFSPFVVKLGTGEGEGGGAFAGMKAALDENNTAALAYVERYLVDSTGYVKASADDTTGIPLKDSYNETEKAAIIAAVEAFREIDWQWRDPLGDVGGIRIKNDWYDCFGHYLAEMAASVGISLWGDYPSRNGVELTVGGRKISFYTD